MPSVFCCIVIGSSVSSHYGLASVYICRDVSQKLKKSVQYTLVQHVKQQQKTGEKYHFFASIHTFFVQSGTQ